MIGRSQGMKEKEITSADNPMFKELLKLERARGIRKQGRALISGMRTVKEVLEEFPGFVENVILSEEHRFESLPVKRSMAAVRMKPELFRRIDFHNTHSPLLVVRVEHRLKWEDTAAPPGCSLCIPFQDPVNVGAVIRSASAFGVSRVILLRDSACPFLPKSVRAAGSALFRIPMLEGPFLRDLRVTSAPIITLSPEGTDISGYTFPESFYLVPGLEGPGLPEHLWNIRALSISMENNVESINAALAAGIALYVWKEGLEKAP